MDMTDIEARMTHPRDIPVAYVAGPYRDSRGPYYVEQNIRRAESVAVELWKLGYAVICPHLNTKHFDGACHDEVWLTGDLAIITRCDLVIVTPDWHRSVGTNNEMVFASQNGVPVLHIQKDFELIAAIGKQGRSSIKAEIQKAMQGKPPF